MEQFSLEKYLENPSRKVVTRDGRPARIVCWDRNTKYWKIVGLVTSPDGSTENPFTYDVNGNESDGCLHDHRNDLFFADEEEKLSEFENMLRYVLECYSGHEFASESEIETLKLNAKSLLDLARKELQLEFDKEIDKTLAETDKIVYQKGQQNVLKSLPKWKKTVQDYYHQGNIPCTNPTISGDEEYLIVGTYEIKISDLETLPKEE